MQLAIRSAAGVLLPLVVWAIFIFLVPRKGSFTLETLKLLSTMVVVNTLLAWIALPILFLFGRAPSDDVTNFLNYSHMPPLLLSFTALVLYANCWMFYLARIDGFRNQLLMFRDAEMNSLDRANTNGARNHDRHHGGMCHPGFGINSRLPETVLPGFPLPRVFQGGGNRSFHPAISF